MNKQRLIIIGTSSTAEHLFSFVKAHDLFDVRGFAVNRQYIKSDSFMGLPVYELESLKSHEGEIFDCVFVAMLWNALNSERRRVYEQVREMGLECTNIISPKASVYGNLSGTNIWVHDYAVIQNDAVIHDDVMIMAHCMVGSRSSVGAHCFMGTKSTIAGGCTVGEQSFIGINSTVFDDTHVGNKCIVGACSAVKRNLPDYHSCKTRLESMQVKAYSPDVIESKLLFRENVRTPVDAISQSLYNRPTTNDQRPTTNANYCIKIRKTTRVPYNSGAFFGFAFMIQCAKLYKNL